MDRPAQLLRSLPPGRADGSGQDAEGGQNVLPPGAFSYDVVYLSPDGYRDLFDRLAMVLNSKPWQYFPPTVRMSDRVMAPVRAPAARRPLRDRLGRRGVAHLPSKIEVIADRFRDNDEQRVFSVEAKREASRVNWGSRSRSRSLSPPISPSFWASVRATAPPANRPRGGRPE